MLEDVARSARQAVNLRCGQLAALAGLLAARHPFGGPPQLSLHLTNRCNIRCAHCYFYSPRADAPNRLSVRRARRGEQPMPSGGEVAREAGAQADTALLRRLIDQAALLGTRRFQFSGYGEPFCHPDCLDLMAHARSFGAQCHTDTNGTLLDGPTADALIDMGFDELRVTTLAGTAEGYARTHQQMAPGGFEELRARLCQLAERKAARGAKRPLVRLVCIVFSENAGTLPDFARFACEVRADAVAFRPFDPVGDPGLRKLLPTSAQEGELKQAFGEARAILDERRVPHNAGRFLLVFDGGLDTKRIYRTVPCYYGWFVMRVDPDGTVYPCCRCYTSLGNAAEENVHAIWHSDAYRRFRNEGLELARRGTPVSGCECGSCVHYDTNLSVFRVLHPLKARAVEAAAAEDAPGG